MKDSTRMLAGAAMGAFVGGMAALLIVNPRSRDALARVNPALDDVSDLLQEFRRALRKADDVAQETRGAVADVRAMLSGADLPTEI